MASALSDARKASDVSSNRLACMLYGSEERLKHLRNVWEFIESDEVFDKSQRPYLNHTQRYNHACRKIGRFAEIVVNLELTQLDDIYDAYLAIDENLPIDVHLSMFIPILKLHCSEEQRKRWYLDAMEFRMIGAYAQTELAHGSNIRGIETTATYDILADEFIIHSPTITSRKFWPGGLAYTATHAIVYANLLLLGVNYGPHPFMVQLRSLDDLSPRPGITLGDIGPKLGYNSMDNGYAMFHQVRIPRRDMLSGFAQVSGAGEYSKQAGAEKVAYGVMLDVRARIIANSAYVLARTLTITIRYSFVRKQGFSSSGKERAVMEYPTQRRRLMILLADTFALHFVGLSIREAYNDYGGKLMHLLPDLHASTAGLKALITFNVSQAMEECRKLCGGHGYLVSAGFAEILMSFLPFCTLEGTMEVLFQQTGKYLVKLMVEGKAASKNAEYLFDASREMLSILPEDCGVTARAALISKLLVAYKRRSLAGVAHARDAVVRRKAATGASDEDALVASGVELCTAAKWHSELLIADSFISGLQSLEKFQLEAAEVRALENLLLLHLCAGVHCDMGSFVVAGVLTVDSHEAIEQLMQELCDVVTVDSLNLIEAFCFSDTRLDSVLGRADGDVHTAIVEATSREPLNLGEAKEGMAHLKKMFQRPRRTGTKVTQGAPPGKLTAKL